MKYRTFGKLGWQISEISFGAWALGGAWARRTIASRLPRSAAPWISASISSILLRNQICPRPSGDEHGHPRHEDPVTSRGQHRRVRSAGSSCFFAREAPCPHLAARQLARRQMTSHAGNLFDPSGGWFLPELARNSFCQSLVRSFRWVVFARTCSKLVPPSPRSILPTGGFCPNLLETRSARSLLDPSDGWFLPELARNSFCQVPSGRLTWSAPNQEYGFWRNSCSTPYENASSAVSSFVFPEITAAIEREMILWSGKEHGAMESRTSPWPGRLTRPTRLARRASPRPAAEANCQ